MAHDADGGDEVCWLGQLCPECGAMPTAEDPGRCWRCGEGAAPPDAAYTDPADELAGRPRRRPYPE